jgi:hypothetical protein
MVPVKSLQLATTKIGEPSPAVSPIFQTSLLNQRKTSPNQIMAEHSKYQQNIIKNYYENRETISLQRAQEIVTELYLSEGKKREKYWGSLANHLEKLEVKPAVIDKLVKSDDPQAAAKLVEKLGRDAA